jgi:hypothetical protein
LWAGRAAEKALSPGFPKEDPLWQPPAIRPIPTDLPVPEPTDVPVVDPTDVPAPDPGTIPFPEKTPSRERTPKPRSIP